MTKVPESVQVLLTNDQAAGRIAVDLDAFVRLNISIQKSLADLEARWQAWMPPQKISRNCDL